VVQRDPRALPPDDFLERGDQEDGDHAEPVGCHVAHDRARTLGEQQRKRAEERGAAEIRDVAQQGFRVADAMEIARWPRRHVRTEEQRVLREVVGFLEQHERGSDQHHPEPDAFGRKALFAQSDSGEHADSGEYEVLKGLQQTELAPQRFGDALRVRTHHPPQRRYVTVVAGDQRSDAEQRHARVEK